MERSFSAGNRSATAIYTSSQALAEGVHMPAQHDPIVGEWYENLAGESFEVIAVDEHDQTVDIQYTDGTIEEIDVEAWHEMELASIDKPADWSGPLDMDREDFGPGLDAAPDDWSYNLGDFDPED
jgi:hypothetical protein